MIRTLAELNAANETFLCLARSKAVTDNDLIFNANRNSDLREIHRLKRALTLARLQAFCFEGFTIPGVVSEYPVCFRNRVPTFDVLKNPSAPFAALHGLGLQMLPQ